MIPAVMVEDIDSVRGGAPGSFEYTALKGEDGPAGMIFQCPCGCGTEGYLAFEGTGQPRPNWKWDGNREKPTLTPSVFNSGLPCQWHGYLTDGEWRPC